MINQSSIAFALTDVAMEHMHLRTSQWCIDRTDVAVMHVPSRTSQWCICLHGRRIGAHALTDVAVVHMPALTSQWYTCPHGGRSGAYALTDVVVVHMYHSRTCRNLIAWVENITIMQE